ncbi:MAG: hypothetical protein Q8O67_03710 [Deltaproteobacteria bacterium]|nr:hypothetical protein [Deltaproteobacteria bacterium]
MNDDEGLAALHDRHHAQLRELLFQTIEHLVVVDVDGARLLFGRFVTELEAGLALEDDVVMPWYRLHGPDSGAGKPDIVDGDHVILRRGIESVRGLLSAAAGLRPILEGLPHVYRLVATLDHHTEREHRHVYPLVAEQLDPAAQAVVVVGLQRILSGLAGDVAAR